MILVRSVDGQLLEVVGWLCGMNPKNLRAVDKVMIGGVFRSFFRLSDDSNAQLPP